MPIKMKRQYSLVAWVTDIEFPKELPNNKTTWSLATGSEQIQHHLLDMRKGGLIVNTSVVIVVGEGGILLSKIAGLSTDILTKE